jgi:nitrogen PTS system EIIA component
MQFRVLGIRKPMNLKIKDICELLQVSEKTVYRWIKDNKIPTYKINNQYRFNKAEINDWILKNKITVTEKILEMGVSKTSVLLVELIRRGGIFYSIQAVDIKEALTKAVDIMKIPQEVSKESVLSLLLEREELMPTTVGKGLAFPHSRNPILADIENESVTVVFLKKELNYQSLDGIPIHTLFIIMSANPKRHLEILSKLSFLCQQNEFLQLLKKRAQKEKIFKYVEMKEVEWNQRMKKND